MKQFNAFLIQIDQFGIPFTPYVHKKERIFKTAISGLLSLVIYSLSLTYFIYIFYLWQSCQMIPIIQQENKLVSERTEQKLQQSPITFELVGIDAATILKGKRVFDVRITEYIGIQPFDRYRIDDNFKCIENPTMDALQSICLDVKNPLSNFLYQDQVKGDNSLMINIYKCDPTEYSNCATLQELQQAIQTQNSLFIRITQWEQQLNLYTGEINSIPIINYLMIDLNQTIFISNYLIQGNYKIDTGLLFEKKNKISTQMINIVDGSLRNLHKKQAYAVIQISLSRRRLEVHVQFPKLGTILAQIGAIFQILMVLQYFGHFFNQKMLDAELIQKISKIYLNKDSKIPKKEAFKYLVGIAKPTKPKPIEEEMTDKLHFVTIVQSIAFIQFLVSKIISFKELEQYNIEFTTKQELQKQQQIEKIEDSSELLLENQQTQVYFFNFPKNQSKSQKNIKVQQVQDS